MRFFDDMFMVFLVILFSVFFILFILAGSDKNGLKMAYNNCVDYNVKMTVEDARDLCKKTVYGEKK